MSRRNQMYFLLPIVASVLTLAAVSANEEGHLDLKANECDRLERSGGATVHGDHPENESTGDAASHCRTELAELAKQYVQRQSGVKATDSRDTVRQKIRSWLENHSGKEETIGSGRVKLRHYSFILGGRRYNLAVDAFPTGLLLSGIDAQAEDYIRKMKAKFSKGK